MENKEKQVISKKRVADHGEVLTARREVDAMLDLVKQESMRDLLIIGIMPNYMVIWIVNYQKQHYHNVITS